MIDCSIININRLIDINCHRLLSIVICYRFHCPGPDVMAGPGYHSAIAPKAPSENNVYKLPQQ